VEQYLFAFDEAEILWWHDRLCARLGRLVPERRRGPLSQLVKSLISSRTRDAVSLAAYNRLVRAWPDPAALASASPARIQAVISSVTFAEVKAPHLVRTLRMIGEERPGFDLGFLARWPEPRSLLWLERFPGVGRKVAAATLNASTLGKRVFIVDSHVHRVLWRLGYISGKASPRAASERVTASARSLDADGLLELFAQMKLLGQTLCRFAAPDCASCPLAGHCLTAAKRH
jgi:endonuclease-3